MNKGRASKPGKYFPEIKWRKDLRLRPDQREMLCFGKDVF